MVKSTGKGGTSGPARIRLVILEAEAPDGDLSQVAQAVQNALRPVDSGGPVRRAISGPARGPSTPSQDSAAAEVTDVEDVTDTVDGEQVADNEPDKRPRNGTSWKPRSPNVVEIDLKSGEMPFADFTAQKKPGSHNMKNLVVAAWLKKYRGMDSISMDHVYTCYRAVGWPSGMADFGMTLRSLKRDKLMDSKGKGLYAINHIGMSKVEDSHGD